MQRLVDHLLLSLGVIVFCGPVAVLLAASTHSGGLGTPVLWPGSALTENLAEAARLDGAGPMRFLWDFVLPLSRGPIAVVTLIGMIWGWNQYLWPLMVAVDDRHWTLMRGLQMVGPGSGSGAALAVLAMLPPLVLVLGVLRLFGRTSLMSRLD